MADGRPKDYSSLYCEDASLTISQQLNIKPPQIPTPNARNSCTSLRSPSMSASHHPSSNNNQTSTSHHRHPHLHQNSQTQRNHHQQPQLPPLKSASSHSSKTISSKLLDGAFNQSKHREQHVDLRQVVAKLQNFSGENNRRFAMDALNKHYNDYFNNRRPREFRVYIQYEDEKETYVVRVDHNQLASVKQKLPKRGQFRYFFKSINSDGESTCEEVEADEASVPFQLKDGNKNIYCQVFST